MSDFVQSTGLVKNEEEQSLNSGFPSMAGNLSSE